LIRCERPDQARAWCAAGRDEGRTIGFVPTMGALHEGHLALVARARAENDLVVASVFVNPLQFGERDDFERYPRDFEGDARSLASVGCDLAFTGTLADFFPAEVGADGRFEPRALRAPGPAARGLEGDLRPGHFAGVATIVARLFEIVRPTRSYFGHKDYQQTLVVAELARELGYPEVVVCPTLRDPDGLAMSSRNRRLSADDRPRALVLSRALRAARDLWQRGERDPARLAERMREVAGDRGVELEYAALRDPERWTPGEPRGPLERAVALVAARVGPVRLIDNLRLDGPEGLS